MMTGHFWYSEKQAQARRRIGHKKLIANIAGGHYVYSEWSHKLCPAGLWKDYSYLGWGSVYSVGGTVQHSTESGLRRRIVQIASHIITPVCVIAWTTRHLLLG